MIDEMLFVEYTCEPGALRTEIWSHSNYFTYVVSGKMILKTRDKDYVLRAGQSYFVKKGGCLIHQFMEETFCDLIIFVPDDFIRGVINRHEIGLPQLHPNPSSDLVIPLNLDDVLTNYYHSLFTFFPKLKPPSKALLKIKFEELIVSLLTRGNNAQLVHYLSNLYHTSKVSITEIMEQNFCRHLSINEFARLSARSLSTFRRDFKVAYGIPPGQWLKERRLDLGRWLLANTDKNMDDILFETGFQNRSHFLRTFKERFGITPSRYRQETKNDPGISKLRQ